MTEDERKELYDWYKKLENYDPDIEEVKARYSEEFNRSIREEIRNM